MIAKVSTRIRDVDEVLLGGIPEGRITLIAGGPGTGKTILGLEILYRGALAGEPSLFVTFEESAAAIRENARAMGWELEPLEQADRLAIIPAVPPPDLVLSGEFSIDGLLAILGGQARALGARRIVVDAIDVLMRVFRDPLRQLAQFASLHQWLEQQGMTATLTAKASKDPTQHAHLDYMADCVIRLEQRLDRETATRRLRVLKYRGSAFLGNEHPYTIESDGFVLMPVSTAELVQQPLGPQMSAGSEPLDDILGGGLRRASSIVIAGASGTGKTTVASTVARAACDRDERVLFVGFEQSREALVSSMLSVAIDFRPALDSGRLQVLSAMPESMGVEEHLFRLFVVLDQFGPEHVVVDAISACRRMGSEQAGFNFLVRLLSWCKARGVTCLCTNQTSDSSEAERVTGFGISSMVDTLILLEQVHTPAYQRRMLVIKSRGVSHSHAYHAFAITDDGLRILAPSSDAAAREAGASAHGGAG